MTDVLPPLRPQAPSGWRRTLLGRSSDTWQPGDQSNDMSEVPERPYGAGSSSFEPNAIEPASDSSATPSASWMPRHAVEAQRSPECLLRFPLFCRCGSNNLSNLVRIILSAIQKMKLAAKVSDRPRAFEEHLRTVPLLRNNRVANGNRIGCDDPCCLAAVNRGQVAVVDDRGDDEFDR
jgi:hypothetical protein